MQTKLMVITRKKTILILLLSALGLGIVLFPVAIIFLQDIVGSFINRQFSHCEVMEKTRFEEALRQGFDVNSGCCAEHMIGECSIARANSTPLIFAIENSNPEVVKLLLQHGADVNQKSEYGYALSTAASLGLTNIVEILLGHETSKESQDIAVRLAAHSGHTEIVKLILNKVQPDEIKDSCAQLACSLVTELEQNYNPHKSKQRDLFLHIINLCLDPNIYCEPNRLISNLGRHDENAPLIKALIEKCGDLNTKENTDKTVREYIKGFSDYNSRPQIRAIIEQDDS